MERRALLGMAAALCAGAARAHEAGPHAGHHAPAPATAQQQPWGIAGDAKAARRTITLRMGDDMRFTPSHFSVRLGETLRLRVQNQGRLLHEIVLGTPQALAAHAEHMRHNPGMAHGEAHMAHVPAGQAGELVWRFNRAGRFAFACLVPGHFEAGMQGSFSVAP